MMKFFAKQFILLNYEAIKNKQYKDAIESLSSKYKVYIQTLKDQRKIKDEILFEVLSRGIMLKKFREQGIHVLPAMTHDQ